MSGIGQRQAGQANAAIDRQNAAIAHMAAGDASARGVFDASKIRSQGGQIIGTARAGAGASGVDVGSRDVQGALGSTRFITDMNVGTTRSNAEKEAWGHEVEASNWEAKARVASAEGNNAMFSSILGAVGGAGMSAYGSGLLKFG
jgi:hypothetical protein